MLALLDDRGDRSCDGLSRRDFVQAGTLAFGGVTLPWLFEQQAAIAASSDGATNARRAEKRSPRYCTG